VLRVGSWEPTLFVGARKEEWLAKRSEAEQRTDSSQDGDVDPPSCMAKYFDSAHAGVIFLLTLWFGGLLLLLLVDVDY
jgi:hypothetical protein